MTAYILTNKTASLARAALAGAGIAMLSTYHAGDQLRACRRVMLLHDHEPDRPGSHAIHLSRRHQRVPGKLILCPTKPLTNSIRRTYFGC